MEVVVGAIQEGLSERKNEKDKNDEEGKTSEEVSAEETGKE
jgi:hypothetical protein